MNGEIEFLLAIDQALMGIHSLIHRRLKDLGYSRTQAGPVSESTMTAVMPLTEGSETRTTTGR